jgi:hypothetical protein
MKVRKQSNVYQLLHSEENRINFNLKQLQPIDILQTQRFHLTTGKVFYKELEPFQRDGVEWEAFIWR